MKKNPVSSICASAVILLLLIALIPLTSGWRSKPLAPAFSMMEDREAGGLPSVRADPAPVSNQPSQQPSASADTGLAQAAPLLPTDPALPLAPLANPYSSAHSSLPPDSYSASGASISPVSPSLPADLRTDSALTKSVQVSPSVHDAVYGTKGKSRRKLPAIPVLNYHSVADVPGNTVVIHPDKLREQLQYLSDNEYHTLTMKEFTDIIEGKTDAPGKAVLLTFDDGYTNNYETAMPMLKEFGFHATLFMSPGMVEDSGYLNWAQVREMQANGWDILPHGMTHPELTDLEEADQAAEIVEARRLIEEQLSTPADIFCYPYGKYNKTTLKILEANGFRYAFTIDQGKTTSDQHPYKLKRIFVNGEEKLSSLVHKLTKW
jgi:peptidoglycan/xylan/chitin deacetylase (PgdA/CDA1 family)